jgi:hypothetical protein
MTEVLWVTVPAAARAVRVHPRTIRVWVYRKKVATRGSGPGRVVSLGDVRRAEKAWRDRVNTKEEAT